jgi:adenosylhomocysteinase
MKKMKSGAILCNAGHFDVEIDIDYLYQEDQNPVSLRADVDCFTFHNKKIFLLAKGRVVNLVSAEGHPPEVMALSFANQLLSILFITKNHSKLNPRIYKVPSDIDYKVAKYSLNAMNIKIDKLTHLQKAYKNSV